MKYIIFNHRGYTGSIEYCCADKVFHGKVLDVHDLVTYEADTERDLYDEFKEAVDDYVESLKALHA